MLSRRHLLALLPASALARSAASNAPATIRRVTAWCASETLQTVDAKVEGKSTRVLRVKRPADDLLLLVLLDVTGDLTLVDPARQALVSEIAKLPSSAWIGVLRCQDGLRVLTDPTADRDASTSAIQNAQVSGRAGLLETIEPAAALAQSLLKKAPVRLAILYVTDSNIFNYREDYTNPVINMSDQRDLSRRFPEALIREKTAKLTASLAATDTPIFIAHLAFLRDRLNEAYQTGLTQMAEATGGQALFCRSQTDIAGTIAQVVDRIRSMWAVDVEVPGGAPRNFTVHLSAPGADLQHRTRFTARPASKE